MKVLVHEFVTGGGLDSDELPSSLAAEGSAMRRALARDLAAVADVEVLMTLDQRLPEEPGPWQLVRVRPGSERTTLIRYASQVDHVALIAPETAGILRERTELIEQVGGRSLGSRAGAVVLTTDKLTLAARLEAKGIPTPRSRKLITSRGLPRDLVYPAVLKPVDGAGSVHTFLLAARDGAPPTATDEPMLLQPYFDGTPMSVTLLVTPDGRTMTLGVGRQRIEVLDGRFQYRGGVLPEPDRRRIPGARELAQRAVDAVPGLCGLVGVDLVVRDELDPHRSWPDPSVAMVVIEINPRPTTSVVGLSRHLPVGALASAWLDAVTRSRIDPEEALARLVHSGDATLFEPDGTVIGTWHPESTPRGTERSRA